MRRLELWGRRSVHEMAEVVCRQAGITAAAFLADCVLDVGVTGNAEFAASATTVAVAFAPRVGDAGLVGGLYRGQIRGGMSVSLNDWSGALGGGETAYMLQSMNIEIQIDPTSQLAGGGRWTRHVSFVETNASCGA